MNGEAGQESLMRDMIMGFDFWITPLLWIKPSIQETLLEHGLEQVWRGKDGYLPLDRFQKPSDIVEAFESIGMLRNPVIVKA